MPLSSLSSLLPRIRFANAAALMLLMAAAALHAQGTLTIRLEDYATAPESGAIASVTTNSIYAARINFLREEPGGATQRLFVCDLNGKLSLLDRATRQFTTYLDFNRNTTETPGATGLFPAFTRAQGYANGLVTFAFDPAYRDITSPHHGKFYTVHIEIDTNDGATTRRPNASGHPGFTGAADYESTAVQEAPGTDSANTRQAVLIEWQDSNPANATFEGTAREFLRVEFNTRIHPMGDLVFSPRAMSPSDPDFRKLYIAVGDGGAGEQNNPTLHPTPQRLDVLQGKILRISPDDPDGAGPQRYGIPGDNPFVASPTARREIYAYGFRNPHRLAWDPLSGVLLAADIGFHSWEEVNIVRGAANYGFGEREGTYPLNLVTGRAEGFLPADDGRFGYAYPVLQYAHSPALGVGDAIAGGFVYRGFALPELRGKYVFGDITTGDLFYADLVEMVTADDNNPATLARFHRLQISWDDPRNASGPESFDRMYEIVAREYRARGGVDPNLPGSAIVSDLTGGGRADIRLAQDHAGELYVLSKTDGMIRAITGIVAPAAAPAIVRHPTSQTIAAAGTVVFAVEASEASAYQWKRDGVALAGAVDSSLTLRQAGPADAGDYTVDVSNARGTVVSRAARLAVVATEDAGRIVNFAVRAKAGLGAERLILGLNLGATQSSTSHTLLVRGLGPALTAVGVPNALANPQLELFRGPLVVRSNDDWEGAGPLVNTIAAAMGALPLGAGSRDAALLESGLFPGSYTVQLSATAGSSPSTGIALAEIFDATPAGAGGRQLLNVAARTVAGLGENTLIAGFVIGGSTARTVLIRAAGPALVGFNVPGTLADPAVTLYRGDTVLATNDDWRSSAELVNAFSATGAFDYVARTKDAALYLTLPPGAYTAHVTGATTTAGGVALIEVYVLP